MANPQFQVVTDEPESKSPKVDKVAINALMLALGALSQRALIAVADLFTLLTVFSVFWLFLDIIPNPNTMQLIGVGAYSAFVLAANIIVRRK